MNSAKFRVASVVLACGVGTSISAQGLSPSITMAQIGARELPLLVYDSVHDRLVLYGGRIPIRGQPGDPNDFDHATYVWDGTGWSIATRAGPRSRDEMAYGYDPRDGSITFFGGRGVQTDSAGLTTRLAFRDTWRFDGKAWSMIDSGGPEPRETPQGAFDVARGRLVVFGGKPEPTSAAPLAATWEWDGRRWTRFDVPGPMPRNGHVMAYDAKSKRVILHGGGSYNGVALTDTWAWDGAQWQLLTMEGPRTRFGAATTALDSGIVVYVRSGARGDTSTTWQLAGKRWSIIAAGGPEARVFPALATDTKRRRIYFISGLITRAAGQPTGLPTDFWYLENGVWSEIRR